MQLSNDFLTARDWHRSVIGSQDMILRCRSALEHLQLFTGYLDQNPIEVYAKNPNNFENIAYHVVDTFDDIEFISIDNVLCTSISQTVNDLLNDLDNIDEQPLVEGLSKYYYTSGQSFDGLRINPENIGRFNLIKDWAIDYYNEV